MSSKPKFAVGDIVVHPGSMVDRFIITKLLPDNHYEAEPYQDTYIFEEEALEHAS